MPTRSAKSARLTAAAAWVFAAASASAQLPAAAPPIASVSFHEAREGRYEISIQYPEIPASFGPTANAFNRAARAAAFGNDVVDEYRKMEPPPHAGAINTYDAEYEITYLGQRLASVVWTISTYTGGAHPNTARAGLLFDLVHARPLGLADLLVDASQGTAAIAERCKQQLEAAAKEERWWMFEQADIGAVVRDPKNWAVDSEGVTVMFDPYTVAAYATGTHACRLPYADLASLLKPGGVLPP
jgi:hypothetical protein